MNFFLLHKIYRSEHIKMLTCSNEDSISKMLDSLDERDMLVRVRKQDFEDIFSNT